MAADTTAANTAGSEPPISLSQLLEAGVHFGHRTTRWNPKMKPYIFGARNGIHIIDLQQTLLHFRRAYDYVIESVAEGGAVLFVGTKKQAQDAITEAAAQAGMFYVTNRWLGGTLTNFRTIKTSIDRLKLIDKMSEDGTFERLTKKEVLRLNRERGKLERNLGGIKDMEKLPAIMFVVDPEKEKIAVAEASKLGIPVIAVADTNCDPDRVDYIIPGNDDAIRAVKLFATQIAEACVVGGRIGRERAAVRATREQQSEADVATIHVASGGDGPKVEVVSRRSTRSLEPEAAASPEEG